MVIANRKWVRVLLICLGAYLVLNLVYAGKSLLGFDFFPGHHGSLFPLGDWLFRTLHQVALISSRSRL